MEFTVIFKSAIVKNNDNKPPACIKFSKYLDGKLTFICSSLIGILWQSDVDKCFEFHFESIVTILKIYTEWSGFPIFYPVTHVTQRKSDPFY